MASLANASHTRAVGRVKHVWGHLSHRTEYSWMVLCSVVAWGIYLRGTSLRVLAAVSASIAFLIAWAVGRAIQKARVCDRVERSDPAVDYMDNGVHIEERRAREAFLADPSPENAARIHAAMIAAGKEWKRFLPPGYEYEEAGKPLPGGRS